MRRSRVPVALVAALVLSSTACGGEAQPRIGEVERGMSKEEVRALLGEPDEVDRDPEGTKSFGLECWSWGGFAQKPAVVCFAGDPASVIDVRGDDTRSEDG